MSKRIIISGRERILKPFIPFFMSLFATGSGELYSGSPQRGIILALLRGASALAIPFYSLTNIKSSYLHEIFFSILFFLLISIFSPFNALFISFKKKKIVVLKYNSAEFITIFMVCNLLITLISISVFFSFFTIKKVNTDYPPLIETGDIALLKKIVNPLYKKGEMVVLKDGYFSYARIIGEPGERVSYNKGRFSVQDSELFQSILTEDELNKFSLTDFDVISESRENLKYPVIQSRDQYSIDILLKNDQYFAAPDDRNDVSGFVVIKNKNIYGRMEGLLFSAERFKFLIKPFQISR